MLSKDRAGFVVNALLIPYLLAAIRMVESGFASAEDVDTGMVAGCAHPMGPLALADLIGLDTTHAVADSMYAEFKEPLYAPPPLLLRMVEAGLLGRKSGRGFFSYDDRVRRGEAGYFPSWLRMASKSTDEVSRTKFACVVASVDDPVGAGVLRGLLLQVEHVLQEALVALQPHQAVLLGLVEDLLAQLRARARSRLPGRVRRCSCR